MFRYSVKRRFAMMADNKIGDDHGSGGGGSDDMAGIGKEYFNMMKALTLEKMELDYQGAVITTYAGVPEKIRPPQ